MNIEDVEKYINRLKLYAYIYTKNASPYRTGALRRNIKIVSRDGVNFSIISPIRYMKYTEEEWDVNFTKSGRKNPNQYWFREVAEHISDKIRRDFNV